jgi:hypothetical protein
MTRHSRNISATSIALLSLILFFLSSDTHTYMNKLIYYIINVLMKNMFLHWRLKLHKTTFTYLAKDYIEFFRGFLLFFLATEHACGTYMKPVCLKVYCYAMENQTLARTVSATRNFCHTLHWKRCLWIPLALICTHLKVSVCTLYLLIHILQHYQIAVPRGCSWKQT